MTVTDIITGKCRNTKAVQYDFIKAKRLISNEEFAIEAAKVFKEVEYYLLQDDEVPLIERKSNRLSYYPDVRWARTYKLTRQRLLKRFIANNKVI